MTAKVLVLWLSVPEQVEAGSGLTPTTFNSKIHRVWDHSAIAILLSVDMVRVCVCVCRERETELRPSDLEAHVLTLRSSLSAPTG